MAKTASSSSDARPKPRVQFGLRWLMLVMLLASVLTACASRMFRDDAVGRLFTLAAVAAPVGTMIIISLCQSLLRLLERRSRSRAADDETVE